MHDDQERALPWCLAAIVVAGILVYLNSFAGVFVYDDLREIVGNRRIHGFDILWTGSRSIVKLTLAINYALGELDVWGYHLVNLVVHVLAALTLFGVVRRVLRLDQFREGPGRHAAYYAAAVALIWVVHPLQTESVTYVIQRAESMMGLFYLLTLYCLVRGATSSRSAPWYLGAVVACALGMGSKAVMITAPLVALLFDRAFLASSFAWILRRRWRLYAGLGATWVIVVWTGIVGTILDATPEIPITLGLGFDGATPLQYLWTQGGVIVHYLSLCFWPHPLCLDYGWPIASTVSEIVGPVLLVGSLIMGSVLVWRRRPWLGFLGLSFFCVLAPTSSIVPSAHAMVEHRMYLSLASVVILSVIGVHFVLDRWYRRLGLSKVVVRWTNGSVLLATVIVYGSMTVWRNADYHSGYRMWENVIDQRPLNPHPHLQIGSMLVADGDYDLAIAALRHALELDPDLYTATLNLSEALLRVGQVKPAVAMARRAKQLEPDRNSSRSVLGLALISDGLIEEGLAELKEATRRLPGDPWSHMSMGRGLTLADKVDEAIEELVEAIRLGPTLTPAGRYLAHVLVLSGDIDAAIARHRHVPGVERAYARAHVLQGDQRRDAGAVDEALLSYQRALEIDPSYRAARARLRTASETPAISSVMSQPD